MAARSLAGLSRDDQRAKILAELEAASGNRVVVAQALRIDRRSLVRIIQRIAQSEADAPPVCAPCGLPCSKKARVCNHCGTPVAARRETIRQEIDRRWGSRGGEQSHREPRKAVSREPSKILHCSRCGGARHYANNPKCSMYGQSKGKTST